MSGAAEGSHDLAPKDVRAVVFGVLAVMGLAVLNQTIVVAALPAIGRDMQVGSAVSWVVSAYFIAGAAATPLFGKLSDIHGRRPTLIAAIVLFAVGSIAAALAPTFGVLVLGRIVQGLGGGAFLSLAQTIMADAAPPRERPRYQVYTTSMFLIASLSGPTIGGVVAEHLHWSAIFWLNVPCSVVALWLAHAALGRLPRHERKHDLDILGAVLVILATSTLLIAINGQGDLRLAAGSVVLWVLFAWRILTAREPLIPLVVLRNRIVRDASAVASMSGAAMVGLSTYLPFFFQDVMGLSLSRAGLELLPMLVGGAIGAVLAGRVMVHMDRYKWILLMGLLSATALTAIYAAVPRALSNDIIRSSLFLFGIATGVVQPVTTLCVQNAMAAWQRGAATASLNFTRQLLAAVVVAGFGALLFRMPGEAAMTSEATAIGFRFVALGATIVLGMSCWFAWRLEEAPLRTTHVAPSQELPGEA